MASLRALVVSACSGTCLAESLNAAKELLASLRLQMPDSPLRMTNDVLTHAEPAGANTKKILVVGDSWGTFVAAGGSTGLSFFQRKLKQHGCDAKSYSIAVPGTMTTDWNAGEYLQSMKKAAKSHDYVWIILMGNDALDYTQDCHQTGKSADECGDELYARVVVNMGQIVDAVHDANPDARVVGFGYDTMFGGLGCHAITYAMFPQCWSPSVPHGGGNRCFNKQFLKIQQVWDDVASNRSWVDSTSILGATQVAGGDTKASTGSDRHIDMDAMGPAKYWPDYEGCFHPGVLGGEDSGAMVVMEEFYKTYWSNQLSCTGVESAMV